MISFLFPINSQKPNYVPTLEDKIEAERQKKVADLKKNGETGTPITPETFAVWQEKNRKMKAEASRVSSGVDMAMSNLWIVFFLRLLITFLSV